MNMNTQAENNYVANSDAEQKKPIMQGRNADNFGVKKAVYAKVGICMLLVGLAAVSPKESNANEFNYNEVEVSLTPDAIDGADPTVSFSGSYEVIESISVIGSYARTTLAESRGIEVDFVNTQIGAAYHRPVQRKTDFIADFSLVRTELVISDDSRSARLGEGSGYRLGAGLRHQYTDRLELHTSIDYLSVESATDTSVTVGGHYFFTERVSAGVGYTTGEFDGFAGSLRMNF